MKNLFDLRQSPPMVYKSEVAAHYLLGTSRKVVERLRDGYVVYRDDPELHADFIPFAKRIGYDKRDLQRLVMRGR